MEKEAGDDYIRRLAAFIRSNEKGLAESVFIRRRPQSPSLLWPRSAPTPVVLSTDTHHLFYTLIRLEALGFDVGSLDVPVTSPSRPMSYVRIYPIQKDPETLSLASLRSSLSLVSNFSLSGSWWTAYDPSSVEGELKYIYSSFTKIPALSIHAPSRKVIAELLEDSTGQNAVPLDVFKNLQRLDCEDVDPRTLLGWDRIADSLRSLRVKRSGLDDISEIFIRVVVRDQARRDGSKRYFVPSNLTPTQQPTSLPSERLETQGEGIEDEAHLAVATSLIPPSKWCLLKHLYLPDNSLTFFPPEIVPYLTSVAHLDLSSNLFVSIPPSLAELTDLISLNMSDNLIDSVQGIFLSLGQVLYLNLSHNRLESLCGLDRLLALERIDLRFNLLEESLEVGRLTVLPNLSELWVEGNPFTQLEEDFRVACFSFFSREGREMRLDGTCPSLYEKRNLASPKQLPNVVAQSTSSAPVISIDPSRTPAQSSDMASSSVAQDLPSSMLSSRTGPKRKKWKRVVHLEEISSEPGPQSGLLLRRISENDRQWTLGSTDMETTETESTLEAREPEGDMPKHKAFGEHVWLSPKSSWSGALPSPARRHSRHRTEYVGGPSSSLLGEIEDAVKAGELKGSSSSIALSKSEKRRTRVSASFFDPSSEPSSSDALAHDNLDAYRKKIESLKQDMGDSWLKVYSQTHSP